MGMSSSFASLTLLTHIVAAHLAFQIGFFFVFLQRQNEEENRCRRHDFRNFSSSSSSSLLVSLSSSRWTTGRGYRTGPEILTTASNPDVPPTLSKLFVGSSTVNAHDLLNITRFGFPLTSSLKIHDQSPLREDNQQVLLLYQNSFIRLPLMKINAGTVVSDDTAALTAHELLSPCRQIKNVITSVIMSNSDHNSRSCTVIVGQHAENHHVSKWMSNVEANDGSSSTSTTTTDTWKRIGRYEFTQSRGYLSDIPRPSMIQEGLNVLRDYLGAYDEALEKLRPIAAQVANAGSPNVRGNLILLVSNFGHSELFLNFICTAKASGVDLSKVLMFATDMETYKLAKSLDIATFYDFRVFANIPHDSNVYGDSAYAKIMMSKVYCVHMISQLGYNFLFSDVDIMIYTPYYLEWFIHKAQAEQYDIFFQHDFSPRADYAPWVSNSGCYYAVNNEMTKALFNDMIYQSDMISSARSHQAALHTVLSEMNSLYGLRIKNLLDDHEKLPIGWHFEKNAAFMKHMILHNRTEQLSFHINWNTHKDIKRQYLEQLGSWYLTDMCATTIATTTATGEAAIQQPNASHRLGKTAVNLSLCCSEQPLIRCHWRDKPSVIPCNESPFSDVKVKAHHPFW